MTVSLEECWKRLGSEPPTGDRLVARAALPEVSARLLGGLDARGRRHLLVRLAEDEAEYGDARGRGVSVRTLLLTMQNEQSGRYLDIECLDPGSELAFDALAADLATRLADGKPEPAEAVRRTLAKWRRFWGLTPVTLLTREQQLGLFAELWFMEMWLKPAVGIGVAVSRWRGPTGGRHDFAWQSAAVEVKATTASRGRLFRINGLEQLAAPEQGDLLFFGLCVQEDASATNSLPVLVSRLEKSLKDDAESLAAFEALLGRAGYSPAHRSDYETTTLAVRAELLFEVRDDFPRLTPDRIASTSLSGIEGVEYVCNLNGSDHLLVTDAERRRGVLT